ncbi:unnamed protein product [Lepeophtheirus salmonis]|uniref:(salmon louse) hypothetical protein n=1 Tax=Lepeophtheirus salmonis TaxID=72036 RepID=A0A7R8D1J9_LEPSM|nr:unnamed protein product [Lepeophtheirus salmonis]CAF2969914.1 unnamed protein product [Lepeophtheirus salmonis]
MSQSSLPFSGFTQTCINLGHPFIVGFKGSSQRMWTWHPPRTEGDIQGKEEEEGKKSPKKPELRAKKLKDQFGLTQAQIQGLNIFDDDESEDPSNELGLPIVCFKFIKFYIASTSLKESLKIGELIEALCIINCSPFTVRCLRQSST